MDTNKAYLIEEGGDIIPITPIESNKGFQDTELLQILQCRITETIRLKNGMLMICDDESKFMNEPKINKKATELFLDGRKTKEQYLAELKKEYGDNVFDMSDGDDELDMSICGHVVVCPPSMFL